MKKNELVRINKEMNLSRVELEEGFQNFYINIIQKINGMDKYEPIKLNKADLIRCLGTNSKNTEYLHNIFLRLTGANEISIGNKKIYGSIFSAKKEEIKSGKETENLYTVYVNDPYKDFLFTKTDIDLMHKVKKYKHLPLSNEEAEYYHKKLKEKKKFLMILNNASIKILRGKNNKIIYSMLKEFAGSVVEEGEFKGQCYRKISYQDFKEALQLSENHRNNNIDRILVKAQTQISELTEITITEIKKYPEGRGAKKEYMVIYFYEKPEHKEKETAEKKRGRKKKAEKIEHDVIDELLNVSADEDTKEIYVEDLRLTELKNLVKQQTKNRKDKYELWAKIICINDIDELYEFIKEKELLINLELLSQENS